MAVDRRITYILEVEGNLVIVENVPARVRIETGEHFSSPEAVEHLHKLIWEERKPDRVMEVPAFEFA